MGNKLTEVGIFDDSINKTLGISLPVSTIYQSEGLRSHLLKHKHFDCLKHLENVPEILARPDYVGVNPNEPDSVEYVKVYEKNILVGVKLETTKGYLYVASVYSLQESKLARRLHSGRLKKCPDSLDSRKPRV